MQLFWSMRASTWRYADPVLPPTVALKQEPETRGEIGNTWRDRKHMERPETHGKTRNTWRDRKHMERPETHGETGKYMERLETHGETRNTWRDRKHIERPEATIRTREMIFTVTESANDSTWHEALY